LKVFRTQLGIRVALGVVGGLLLPILLLAGVVPAAWPLAGAALLLCVLGEMLERHLFFVCEAAPRMPGGLAA
jgi:DMSO reductase anchor subunit